MPAQYGKPWLSLPDQLQKLKTYGLVIGDESASRLASTPSVETIMTKHPKLDLIWIGRENRPKLEQRILIEDLKKRYHVSSAQGLTAKTPGA